MRSWPESREVEEHGGTSVPPRALNRNHNHAVKDHIDAWTSTRNEHFRAKAWNANKSVKVSCPTYDARCPTDVVEAVQQAYND